MIGVNHEAVPSQISASSGTMKLINNVKNKPNGQFVCEFPNLAAANLQSSDDA